MGKKVGFHNAVGCERKERDNCYAGGGSFPLSYLLNNTLQKLYSDSWSQLFTWNGSGTAGTVPRDCHSSEREKKVVSHTYAATPMTKSCLRYATFVTLLRCATKQTAVATEHNNRLLVPNFTS